LEEEGVDCNERTCYVERVEHKTSAGTYAGTDDYVTGKAFTKDGVACNLGTLDDPQKDDRIVKAIDVYEIAAECRDACMKEDEVFAYLELTIDGTDGWMSDWVDVTVNGIVGRYEFDNQYLDDKKTERYDKQ
jgi:hypothetical protein